MGYNTITGALATTLTRFGGDIMNTVAQLFSGVNVGTADSTNKPDIGTDFRFRSSRLRFKDTSSPTPREINLTFANQGADKTINIPALANATNNLVLTDEIQTLKGKSLNAADNNTFSNIPAASVSGLSVASLQNVGTGTGQVYKSVAALIASLRTIKGGSNVSITNNTDDITIDANPASIGGYLPLAGDFPSTSSYGNHYVTIGGDTTNTTLANRTIKTGMDMRVTAIRANVLTHSLNGNLELGIVDDGTVVAKITLTSGQTGQREATGLNVNIAAGSLIALNANTTTASSGAFEVRPLTIEVVSGAGASAHKATHIVGGSDAFAKGDDLNASAKYLEDIADPASDSQRLWIADGTNALKYWSDETTPVKHTVERQANKGVASGYAALDGSSLIPLANLGNITTTQISSSAGITSGQLAQITDKAKLHSQIAYYDDTGLTQTYLRTQRNQKWGDHTLSTATGGAGLFNGFLTSAGGTFTASVLTTSGLKGRFTTGSSAGNPSGFCTTGAITNRSNLQWLHFKVQLAALPSSMLLFIGLISSSTLTLASDVLNAKHGIGVYIDTAGGTNFRIARNDGSGATVFSNFTTPRTGDTLTAFSITCNDATPNWTISQEGVSEAAFTTDIPGTSDLFACCLVQTGSGSTRSLDIRYFEFRGN